MKLPQILSILQDLYKIHCFSVFAYQPVLVKMEMFQLVITFYKCFVENIFFVLEGNLNIFTSYVSSCMHLKFYENLQVGVYPWQFESSYTLLQYPHPLLGVIVTFLKCVIKFFVTHNTITNSNSPKVWRRYLAPVLLSGLKSLAECVSLNASCTCN